jgi:hypothetical protein
LAVSRNEPKNARPGEPPIPPQVRHLLENSCWWCMSPRFQLTPQQCGPYHENDFVVVGLPYRRGYKFWDRAFLGVCSDAKDWAVFVSYGESISASGLVALTFNHRLPKRSQVKAAVTSSGTSEDRGLQPLPRGYITALAMSGLRNRLNENTHARRRMASAEGDIDFSFHATRTRRYTEPHGDRLTIPLTPDDTGTHTQTELVTLSGHLYRPRSILLN